MLQTAVLQTFPLRALFLARVGQFWVSQVGSEDFGLELPGPFHVAFANRQVVPLGRLDVTVTGKLLHDMDRQGLSPVSYTGPTKVMKREPLHTSTATHDFQVTHKIVDQIAFGVPGGPHLGAFPGPLFSAFRHSTQDH